MFKTLERAVPKEDWYEGDFRAQIVTYSIAKMASMIEGSYVLDFDGIWRKQALSPALLEQLRSIARAVSRIITSPPRGTRNVGEWCKRDECWESVNDAAIPLRSGLRAELKKIDR
jgi:hypothetical protein